MSATQDVKHTLDKLLPEPGESVEDFARRGLRWQNEVYSANAGCDLDITWDTISDSDRKGWLRWAKGKMGVAL